MKNFHCHDHAPDLCYFSGWRKESHDQVQERTFSEHLGHCKNFLDLQNSLQQERDQQWATFVQRSTVSYCCSSRSLWDNKCPYKSSMERGSTCVVTDVTNESQSDPNTSQKEGDQLKIIKRSLRGCLMATRVSTSVVARRK